MNRTEKQPRLKPECKILSGIAINLSGEVSDEYLRYIKDWARRRSGSIQTLRFNDGKSESVVIFEYYGNAKGLKLVRYHFRKFFAATCRHLNLGDVLVSVVIKGNTLTGFPVYGAGKSPCALSYPVFISDKHVR